MKKLVVMGLAMAMTAAMVNGVCAQPVQAADGEGLKVALLLSGAANDQGWNQTRPDFPVHSGYSYYKKWKERYFQSVLITDPGCQTTAGWILLHRNWISG